MARLADARTRSIGCQNQLDELRRIQRLLQLRAKKPGAGG
nr:hypothetical protein [uncultured bacterium]